MEGFYGSHEEEFEGGLDVQHEAKRFEDRISQHATFYMDALTIDEVYDYYRAMDESSKAKQLLDFAVQHYPYNAEFYFKQSCLSADLDLNDEALKQIELALELAPSETTYWVQKARVLSGLARFDDAYEMLERALELTDQPAEVEYHLGQLRQAEGKLDEAISLYKASLVSDPSFEDALYEIVLCYESSDRMAEGVEYVQAFIAAAPYSACGWYNLGTLLHKQGLFEKAIWAFDYAILIQEDFLSAYAGKASSFMELHNTTKPSSCCCRA